MLPADRSALFYHLHAGDNVNTISLNQFFYNLFPKLYGEMSTAALEISGITRIASQPVLNLKGQGVLIGIADAELF